MTSDSVKDRLGGRKEERKVDEDEVTGKESGNRT